LPTILIRVLKAVIGIVGPIDVAAVKENKRIITNVSEKNGVAEYTILNHLGLHMKTNFGYGHLLNYN
jgi:hypothetical protein